MLGSAVGFPALDKDIPRAFRLVDMQTTHVEPAGGEWGPGVLVLDDVSRDWRWEPIVAFSSKITPR